MADEWATGFAALLETNEIPDDIADGWSVVIVFDKPLGKVKVD